MKENWIVNGEVRLHYLDSNPDNQKEPPLLICPGLSEPAENYIEVMTSLLPRRCITFANRGRGKSSSPETGYTLEHHINDIEAIVKELGLNDFYLMGYSRGVSYALGYAIQHSDSLKGLILAEYPAKHKKMPQEWVDKYLKRYWDGSLGANLMKPHVVKGIANESKDVDFRDGLAKITCPTLIMRGVLEESLLSEEEAKRYIDHLQNGRVEVFSNSGHTLKESETKKFINTLKEFLMEANEK